MKEIRILSAHQINFLDEIQLDREATEATLNVSLNFHTNRMNELAKKNKDLWKELTEIHNLDPTKLYKVISKDGVVQIIEIEDDKNGKE